MRARGQPKPLRLIPTLSIPSLPSKSIASIQISRMLNLRIDLQLMLSVMSILRKLAYPMTIARLLC